jgi:hypothetical protein
MSEDHNEDTKTAHALHSLRETLSHDANALREEMQCGFNAMHERLKLMEKHMSDQNDAATARLEADIAAAAAAQATQATAISQEISDVAKLVAGAAGVPVDVSARLSAASDALEVLTKSLNDSSTALAASDAGVNPPVPAPPAPVAGQ